MAKLSDKLWNWGHLEGSHNQNTGMECAMTPEAFAQEYGIPNAFIVSYGGNITPPFDGIASRFTSLKQVKWSVLGDASTPLPSDELGWTTQVCDTAAAHPVISGAVVDDFFSPKRVERFTRDVLRKMKAALNERGLDFWCVLYRHELDVIKNYLDCFDGITFWFWRRDELLEMEQTLDRLFAAVGEKPVMLGMYIWDYSGRRPMEPDLFRTQLAKCDALLRAGKIEGIVFCSSTLGDADLETNRILKEYVRTSGEEEIG